MKLKPLIMGFIIFFLVMGLKAETLPDASSTGVEALKEVMARFWELIIKYDLSLRQKYGLKIEVLPRFSYEEAEADIREVGVLLEKLQAIKVEELSHEDQLSQGIMAWYLSSFREGHRFFWLRIPLAPHACPFPWLNRFFSDFPFKEKGDLEVYLRLLKQYPRFVEEILAILKQQYQRKIILAKPALEIMLPYFEALLQPADKNVLAVATDRLQQVPSEDVKGFRENVAEVITNSINPILEKTVDFIKGEYRQKAPEQVGMWQYPQGMDYYRFLVRKNTTLDITPEEVHRIGLKEIQRLLKELDRLQGVVKFKGDRAAFVHFLKTDPRFLAPTIQVFEEKLVFYTAQAEAKLDLLFNKKAQAPCGVKRLDPLLESSMAFGYYQVPTAADSKGYYMYNGANSKKASLVFVPDLMLHELLPGHHFQVALQSENTALPVFRREAGITAYVEGWGEYAADLGEEMGIYNDPYAKCGRILGDMFMAVRLVVDTGMNYYKWPRRKAMDFMKQHYLLLSDEEIRSETLRYSTGIPGQALAYKMGNIKIHELREKAKKALGDKFDIRAFHDVLLGSGDMPLKLLEKHIRWFLSD